MVIRFLRVATRRYPPGARGSTSRASCIAIVEKKKKRKRRGKRKGGKEKETRRLVILNGSKRINRVANGEIGPASEPTFRVTDVARVARVRVYRNANGKIVFKRHVRPYGRVAVRHKGRSGFYTWRTVVLFALASSFTTRRQDMLGGGRGDSPLPFNSPAAPLSASSLLAPFRPSCCILQNFAKIRAFY